MTAFEIWDVFTDSPFGGNPLGVVFGAEALQEDQLQRIAREFNFSETVFIYPPANPANTARVRIFTPGAELPFAGHPTIGTSLALSAQGQGPDLTLELGVGPIPVTIADDVAQFALSAPFERLGDCDLPLIAACLNLDQDQIKTDKHVPLNATSGLSFCFVEVRDRAALAAADPDIPSFRTAAGLYSDRANFGVYCYARQGDELDARMFAPTGGILEDPATGSASAAVTALIATIEERSVELTLRQGEDMGRLSNIRTGADFEGGRVVETRVAGRAVKVAEGKLTLR